MSLSPATAPSVQLIRFTHGLTIIGSYVHALRDARVPSDRRVGPSATFDWLLGVHERQLQRLARMSERHGTRG
jgi:hypothetical protein